MEEANSWRCTVIRAQGHRLLHSQKSWRPIVTIEIDECSKHETILGVDGQNPNLKETFYLQEAIVDSKVQISVWNRSQSKKKSKKRNLLATASHTLGELFSKQEGSKPFFKVPLECRTLTKRAALNRGKRQDEVALHLKLRAPASVHEEGRGVSPTSEEYEIDAEPETDTTDSAWNDAWGDDDTLLWSPPRRGDRIKKKPTRGYAIESEHNPSSSEDESDHENTPVFQDGWDGEKDALEDALFEFESGVDNVFAVSAAQQAASILPQHTEEIPIPTDFTFFKRALASFTIYRELSTAKSDAHFEKVFCRLQTEWTYVGGLLVALAAVNTAVFAISPDSVFTVDSHARKAIAASSIASGLGIACVSWILLRYNWVDLDTFKTRALDVLGSYFFFSLSARVPSICTFLSAFCLMSFLALVAFDAWPEGVLVMFFLIGFIMTLQFLAFGVKWAVEGVARCGSGVRRIFTGRGNDVT